MFRKISEGNSRRSFLKKASMSSVAMLAIPSIVSNAFAGEYQPKWKLSKGSTILFQGDSITDAYRKKEADVAAKVNEVAALGMGYAFLAASELLYNHPEEDLKIYNRGISGNKVYQLAERWDEDCLKLQPDVLSILIGVNDFWHLKKHSYTGTLDTYTNDLDALLARTKEALPNVKFIIGEPFVVKGVKVVDDTWFPAFAGYQRAAKKLADKYEASFIPYQKVFDEALKSAPGSYWTPDGVHPSVAGAKLMAHAWLKTVTG